MLLLIKKGRLLPRYPIEKNPNDYKLFLDFKEIFFIKRYSYFDKTLKVISKENLDEFEERFIKNYISGNEENFNEKSSKQLENSSREFKHLFSNYIWLYNFFFSSVDDGNYKVSKFVSSKQQDIESYLEENIDIQLIPKFGFANCGTSYNTRKDIEMRYIHLFTREIFKNPNLLDEQENLIEFIKKMNVKEQIENYVGANLFKSGIKNILLFLFIPDMFEPIVSYEDKNSIVNGFGKIDSEKDIDENLLLIREKFNINKSFYEEEYLDKWVDVKYIKKNNINEFRKARVITTSKNPTTIDKKFKLKTNDDLHQEYNNKLKAGENAEDAVFINLHKKFMSNKKDIEYFNIIFQALCKIYPFEEVQNLRNKSLKEISMFSKYIHTNAPFDIIYVDGSNIKFVEVKSCLSKPYKIYMSIAELNFAYENKDHYELIIVINNEIFTLERLPIEQIYNQVKEINSINSLLSISNFELSLEVD